MLCECLIAVLAVASSLSPGRAKSAKDQSIESSSFAPTHLTHSGFNESVLGCAATFTLPLFSSSATSVAFCASKTTLYWPFNSGLLCRPCSCTTVPCAIPVAAMPVAPVLLDAGVKQLEPIGEKSPTMSNWKFSSKVHTSTEHKRLQLSLGQQLRWSRWSLNHPQPPQLVTTSHAMAPAAMSAQKRRITMATMTWRLRASEGSNIKEVDGGSKLSAQNPKTPLAYLQRPAGTWTWHASEIIRSFIRFSRLFNYLTYA